MARLILILGFFFFLAGCHDGVQTELILFDFESDSELDRLHWKCHTLLQLSDRHVTHGARCLHLELYPSGYPGLNPMLQRNDWRGYRALCFDIYNPNEQEIRIVVRIDDRKDYPDYADRYNQSYMLKRGMNRINIKLDSLITSGTRRNLSLRTIHRFLIFMVKPAQKVDLYVDYGRLVS